MGKKLYNKIYDLHSSHNILGVISINRNGMERHEQTNIGGFGGFPYVRETTCENEAYASE